MIQKVKCLIDYFKYLKNPVMCLLFKFKLKKNITIKFKNSNKTIITKNINLLNKIMSFLPHKDYYNLDELIIFFNGLYSTDKIISWGGANILNPNIEKDLEGYPFYEYFMPGYYTSADIDYKNRIVIDIGSFVGDTAILFAKQGAEVYGFEPVKKNYEYSLKMKEINPNLKSKLHFFNLGVSDKIRKINIKSLNSTSAFRDEHDAYEVDITTIDNILIENEIEPDILKMDCEGCEYNIILNLDLSNFKEIIFEHHAELVGKEYTILTEKLINQGFEIKKIPLSSIEFERYGLIYAFKK